MSARPEERERPGLSRRRFLMLGSLGAGAAALAAFGGYRLLRDRGTGDPFERGLELHRERRYAEAASMFQRAAEERPNDLQPLILLGSARANAGQHREAVEVFSRAIALDPSGQVLYLYRGESLAAMGDGAGARRDFEVVLEMTGGQGGSGVAARAHLEELETTGWR